MFVLCSRLLGWETARGPQRCSATTEEVEETGAAEEVTGEDTEEVPATGEAEAAMEEAAGATGEDVAATEEVEEEGGEEGEDTGEQGEDTGVGVAMEEEEDIKEVAEVGIGGAGEGTVEAINVLLS